MSRLRKKNKKYFSNEYVLGKTNKPPKEQINLIENLTCDRFSSSLTKKMKGDDFTLKHLQNCGFKYPVLFAQKDGLGITVPNHASFTVTQVRELLGDSKEIVMKTCQTQVTKRMTLVKFVEYYLKKNKDEIYDVLPLEFSNTKMGDMVKRPFIVDTIDWVNLALPARYKKAKKRKYSYYPKVQNYCQMSVAGSYTSFHITCGGSSLWCHVLKGTKIFWLIEPTLENLDIFKLWMTGNGEREFLGDLVGHCERVELEAGMTFLIPSGWIHAVYTPENSIVFSGNFLHSFDVPMQERVVLLEEDLDIPREQRLPFSTQLKWYLLEYYVYQLEGKSYLTAEKKKDRQESELIEQRHQHTQIELSSLELEGLFTVLNKLEQTKDEDYVPGLNSLEELHLTALRTLKKYRDSISLADVSLKRKASSPEFRPPKAKVLCVKQPVTTISKPPQPIKENTPPQNIKDDAGSAKCEKILVRALADTGLKISLEKFHTKNRRLEETISLIFQRVNKDNISNSNNASLDGVQ